VTKKDVKRKRSGHQKTKMKNMSTLYLSKEQAILEKIDNYIKDKLSDDEKDLLWLELSKSEDFIDRLELELLLMRWAEIYR
jgi:hypothetical protein